MSLKTNAILAEKESQTATIIDCYRQAENLDDFIQCVREEGIEEDIDSLVALYWELDYKYSN